MQNGCHLITYPDSMGGNISALREILSAHFADALTGVHILPFYPSSADRGFAPLEYAAVEPAFGSWEDMDGLRRDGLELTFDFMINHLSRQSKQFQDFLTKGSNSVYRDFFIRFSQFWPGGEASDEDLAKIYTRKPRPPYLELELGSGENEKVWCTFDEEQIDLNLASPETRRFVEENLTALCRRGAATIRLDAFAYASKQPGSDCFFVEPDVWEILEWAAKTVEAAGGEVLPEIHEHYTIQQKLADRGYWVYDFALPMLLLQAIYDRDPSRLKHWFSICPRKQVTTLDTHDGIGVVDVRDLLSDEEIERTKNNLFTKGANVKRIYNTPQYNNLDIYQVNCTYYSALGDDDAAYLLARAIQFFAPGIPQVYYVGLLAGKNDIELLEQTKNGRDINRHSYTEEEIRRELERPVVRRLRELMIFRSTHPAFEGDFNLTECEAHTLEIEWRNGNHRARIKADMRTGTYRIEASGPEEEGLIELSALANDEFRL